jgi:EEF1A N-terminal glycine/lysine methyltransferase
VEPEVLGSTVSPGAGSKKTKCGAKNEEFMKGAGALSKQEVGKMLSNSLKVSQINCSFKNFQTVEFYM